MTLEQAIARLNETEKALYALNHALSVLYTDGATAAPKNSWKGRGEASGYLSGLYHEKMNDPELSEVLETILANREQVDEVTFRRAEVMKEGYDEAHILSKEEVVEYQKLTNESSAVWHEAKVRSDFASFAPYLEKLVEARRAFAAKKDPAKPAYDVLLDLYEKDITMAQLDPFFSTLREDLSPLIAEIAARPKETPAFLKQEWPAAQQRDFSARIMKLQGIDPDCCTLGETEHPFTNGTNKWDVRITTHYHDDPLSSLYSVIHEGGHALYELGIRDDLQFTCLAGGATMGIHESQSRFYENLIGRSRAFCAPLLKAMQESFTDQMKGVTEEELYSAINLAQPSLIRTEADELTYSLHVMIRYELEKALFSGSLAVKDLPGVWNECCLRYLGVTVPDDRRGVLQDSHWSTGLFGYFPSYALGSAYGVQMLRNMEKDLDVWKTVQEGNLAPVTAWLAEKIHQYGQLKKPRDLLPGAMGGPLDPAVYTGYLKEKFSALYSI